MFHALRDALAAFRRTPLLTGLSAAMIGFSLFLVGLFGILAHNVHQALRQIQQRVEIVAYLRDDASLLEVEAAQQQIRAIAQVREVRYVSRDQALQQAQTNLPEFRDVLGGLEINPLPASLEVALHPGQREAVIRGVADRLGAYPFVEDVRYGSDYLDDIFMLRRVAAATTLVLGNAFALAAAFIIGAAVRIAIYARRDEIAIMQLVGATRGFVRRPFIAEGFLTGLAGGALALLLTYGAFTFLSDVLMRLEWLPRPWIASGIAAGCLLGAIAAAIAVRRYLRDV